jgi:hypothetical protein
MVMKKLRILIGFFGIFMTIDIVAMSAGAASRYTSRYVTQQAPLYARRISEWSQQQGKKRLEQIRERLALQKVQKLGQLKQSMVKDEWPASQIVTRNRLPYTYSYFKNSKPRISPRTESATGMVKDRSKDLVGEYLKWEYKSQQ